MCILMKTIYLSLLDYEDSPVIRTELLTSDTGDDLDDTYDCGMLLLIQHDDILTSIIVFISLN